MRLIAKLLAYTTGETTTILRCYLNGRGIAAQRRNKAGKNTILSWFHSDQTTPVFLPSLVNNVAPICQRAPCSSQPLPFLPRSTAQSLSLATSPPRGRGEGKGCNEPHFHGGGDTSSSSRRREATKKWSRLCQPRRSCRQSCCQTSRISLWLVESQPRIRGRTSHEQRDNVTAYISWFNCRLGHLLKPVKTVN